VLNALPVIAGWAIPAFQNFYTNTKKWIRNLLKAAIVITVCLNLILLLAITFIPYSQTIYFSYLLKKKMANEPVTVFCPGQTPFETPGKNQMTFYKNGAKNITLKQVANIDSVNLIRGKNIYIAATFNEIKDKMNFIRQSGFKPVLYSSDLVWKTNEFLQSKKIVTINEIWVLYKKE
jgi:hypothetical protein